MRKGRFSKPAPEIVQRYSESVSFDWRLCRYDIAGSIAHAAALAQAGIITADEREKIERELRVIEKEIETGKFEWDQSLEDVHMNIEAALTKRIGAAGARLHTARSRNDQIALDLRLYVKAEIANGGRRLRLLQTALLDLAEQHLDVVMAGYTHLQRAQPIFSRIICLPKSKPLSGTRSVFVIAIRERISCRSGLARWLDRPSSSIAKRSRASSAFPGRARTVSTPSAIAILFANFFFAWRWSECISRV